MGNFPKSILGIILVITLLNIGVHSQALKYPAVPRDEKTVDDYHGTKVPDPYRWLEQPDSERVDDFISAQNDLTFTYLNDCQQRKQFRDGLEELWRYPKFGRPEKRGNRYFYFAQQRGGEVLHVQESRDSVPRALIDPQDNGVLAFPNFGVSRDGDLVVYREVLTAEGVPSVTGNLKVLNVSTGFVYPETVEDVRNPQIAWDSSNRGFFYFSHRKADSSDEEDETPPPPPKFYVYYHRVGSSAEEDALVVDYADFFGEPSFVDMETSEDGKYLLLRTRAFAGTSQNPQTNSTLYVAEIGNGRFGISGVASDRLQLVPMISKQNSAFVKYITNVGSLFYFRSKIGNNNRNYKLVEVDLTNPAEANWRVVVDENPDYTLQAATGVDKNKMVLSYTSEKLNSYAELRELQTGSVLRTFPLEFGELLSFSGNMQDSEVLFRSTKLEGLPELFYFDAADPQGSMKRLISQPPLSNYDASQFVTSTAVLSSPSGGDIEMILLHRKDLKRDGSAYAFIVEREFDLDFYFRVYFSYMKDFQGVVAFPTLSDENGIGFRDSALEDFIAAADYLVEQRYTSNSRIIARGQSTFGLFVAAAVNRRPELFGAVVPSLVAFDMLRYEAASNGSNVPTQDPEGFAYTYALSPLHNIRAPAYNQSVQYPAVFIPTPLEYPVPLAFKYLSQLQNTLGKLPGQTNPFLLRMVPEPQDTQDIGIFARYHVDRETDVRCFFEKTLGLRMIK